MAGKRKQKVELVWRPKTTLANVYVDNPFHSRAHDAAETNPVKIKAQVNIKESAIATLAARGHINEAQVRAADRFRSLWEAMGGAGAGSFDYSREPVDGGGPREPLTERQIRAGLELKMAREALGNRAYGIMSKIAGEGYAIQELATSHRERTTLTDYLKDGLDELARSWGYENRGTQRKSA
ncbi:hypothetical protein [Rhizobium hidalgonense]|uniref:Uncharacterized protein n=1 Tax=Rhizobium hidalgonense TaxID=1538159 RepID=A0ABX4JK77_9HYPH|nr:hypothetical protein [Rhizobium hidalgonense]PDT19383.1 hypothetical protein CO674_33195 [Rhizobium hidalgonense]PON04966.1 hypothetical protein ATY29_24080 [Rhizobium hidalgonense]